jgi:hypothetical protein
VSETGQRLYGAGQAAAHRLVVSQSSEAQAMLPASARLSWRAWSSTGSSAAYIIASEIAIHSALPKIVSNFCIASLPDQSQSLLKDKEQDACQGAETADFRAFRHKGGRSAVLDFRAFRHKGGRSAVFVIAQKRSSPDSSVRERTQMAR